MSRRPTQLVLLFALIFSSVVLIRVPIPVGASPKTWYVPIDFPTIQTAIDSPLVVDGDTIFVYNGTYNERVSIDKSILLIGENRSNTIIDGGGTGVIIDITVSHTTVTEFTVQNGSAGIMAHGVGDTNILSNVVVHNGWIGIYLFDSNNNTIKDNISSNNGNAGISSEFSNDNTILENKLANNTYGIYLRSSHDNEIIGCNITENEFGIYSESSNNNVVKNNSLDNNQYGAGIQLSGIDNLVQDNVLERNRRYGIAMSGSNNTALNNTLTDNRNGLHISGSSCMILNNVVNLTTSYWYYGEHGLSINGDNNAIMANRVEGSEYAQYDWGLYITGSNNTVSRNKATNNDDGILISGSNNTVLENNATDNGNIGIFLHAWAHFNNVINSNVAAFNKYGVYGRFGGYYEQGHHNAITNNLLTGNEYGLYLYYYSYYGNGGYNNTVRNNTVAKSDYGIYLYDRGQKAYNNTIDDNVITESGYGIYLDGSYSNIVEENVVTTSDWTGIYINNSRHNLIVKNSVTNNVFGMRLEYSQNNSIYHNNFIENTIQASNYPGDKTNMWDDGYPSGGNYWSDYTGEDLYMGSYQNETGNDGIGDIPYSILANNTDNYPLMKPYPYGAPTISIYTDKQNYTTNDTMEVGLHVINLGDSVDLCVKVWLQMPTNETYLLLHVHNITLPARLDYNNPTQWTFTVPNITPGTYVWHAALLNPATHAIIVEDTAEWEFS